MKGIVALCCIFLFLGCAQVSVVEHEHGLSLHPTDAKNIKVFVEKPTDKEFTKLAEVTVDNINTWKDAVNKLKKEAAKLGGDAVYIVSKISTSRIGVIIVTGVVIKYKGRNQ
ncbi:MAG: hypothetical protein DRH17_03305 [Deltaproteobacteria bacterium]|nr:MAG: hypothetical protein DRH17_03305 [Deltaproteobacteria bacterium]